MAYTADMQCDIPRRAPQHIEVEATHDDVPPESREDAGPVSITTIPSELLSRILSKLPYDQRLACSTVCHTFNDALRRATSWPDLLLRARGVYPTQPSKQLVYWLAPRYAAA